MTEHKVFSCCIAFLPFLKSMILIFFYSLYLWSVTLYTWWCIVHSHSDAILRQASNCFKRSMCCYWKREQTEIFHAIKRYSNKFCLQEKVSFLYLILGSSGTACATAFCGISAENFTSNTWKIILMFMPIVALSIEE